MYPTDLKLEISLPHPPSAEMTTKSHYTQLKGTFSLAKYHLWGASLWAGREEAS